MLRKRRTLINCMNSRQWLLMRSFLGPVGLAISSMTPPASSKTRTISCYDTGPSETKAPKNENHFCLDMLIKGNLLCNIIIYLLHILKPLQRSVLALWIHRVSASLMRWDSIECRPMLVSGLSSKFLDLNNWKVSWIVFCLYS